MVEQFRLHPDLARLEIHQPTVTAHIYPGLRCYATYFLLFLIFNFLTQRAHDLGAGAEGEGRESQAGTMPNRERPLPP